MPAGFASRCGSFVDEASLGSSRCPASYRAACNRCTCGASRTTSPPSRLLPPTLGSPFSGAWGISRQASQACAHAVSGALLSPRWRQPIETTGVLPVGFQPSTTRPGAFGAPGPCASPSIGTRWSVDKGNPMTLSVSPVLSTMQPWQQGGRTEDWRRSGRPKPATPASRDKGRRTPRQSPKARTGPPNPRGRRAGENRATDR